MIQQWKVKDSDLFCHDNCGGRCPTCSIDQQAYYKHPTRCGILAGGLFSSCHETINPNLYLDNCVYDVCLNKGKKNNNILFIRGPDPSDNTPKHTIYMSLMFNHRDPVYNLQSFCNFQCVNVLVCFFQVQHRSSVTAWRVIMMLVRQKEWRSTLSGERRPNVVSHWETSSLLFPWTKSQL